MTIRYSGSIAENLARRYTIRHGVRGVAIRLQHLAEKVATFLIIIDYQNLVHKPQNTVNSCWQSGGHIDVIFHNPLY